MAVDMDQSLGARARSELDRLAAVEKVIDAMHERIDRPFGLDEMAAIAFLSRFYFNRVFREITGLPPVRFHTALRIAEAKRLLVTTDLSVTEVCFEVGYQSLGTFTTHFHELVGVSPRALRRAAAQPAAPTAEIFEPRVRAPQQPPAVEGDVRDGADDQLVFIGLFREPYPQGLPLACAAIRGGGPYELCTAACGSSYVAAVASACDHGATRVAVTRRQVHLAPGRTTRRDLRLRPVRRTDPPILLALPVGSRSHDHGLVGDQPMPKAAGTLITS
jgi:AraC-like DNA-binding protein